MTWRVGGTVGRTVYLQRGDHPAKGDDLIGVLDTPKLAQYIVDAVNGSPVRDGAWDWVIVSEGRVLHGQRGAQPSCDDEDIIGLMDTPELAAQVVAAMNSPTFRWTVPDEDSCHVTVREVRRDGPEHLGWRS